MKRSRKIGGADNPEEVFVGKEAQASQYARSLIEASLDPLVTISPDGKITDYPLTIRHALAIPAQASFTSPTWVMAGAGGKKPLEETVEAVVHAGAIDETKDVRHKASPESGGAYAGLAFKYASILTISRALCCVAQQDKAPHMWSPLPSH